VEIKAFLLNLTATYLMSGVAGRKKPNKNTEKKEV